MKKRIVIYIIVFQVILISVIGYQISKKKSVLGETSVNVIPKNSVTQLKTDKFNHFYEPNPNTNPERGVTINNDSLNERFSYSEQKPEDAIRIVALGDSWTYGLHVPTSENWTEVLEDEFKNVCTSKKIEVINLGVHGYDTAYEIERFKRRGIKYDPDLVIWLLTDMRRVTEWILPEMGEEATKSAWKRYFGPARKKVIIQTGLPQLYKYQMEAAETFRDFYKNDILISAIVELMSVEEVDLVKSIAKKIDANLNTINSEIYYSQDLRLSDGHPNDKGHRVIAGELYDHIIKNNLISCN